MLRVIIYNFKIALEALVQNKLRAVLTSLGIIFGVASVIAMLAIGKGAQSEILEKMQLLGTNNIIIEQLNKEEIKKQKEASDDEEQQNNKKFEKDKYIYGLTLEDANSIEKLIPNIEFVSPEILTEKTAIYKKLRKKINLIGVTNSYFEINPFELYSGSLFLKPHFDLSQKVCIIASEVQTKLFAGDDPIGKFIKCGKIWLKVIGVLKKKYISKANIENLKLRDYNLDVYIPINTMLLRFKDKNTITEIDIKKPYRFITGEMTYTQLDKIVARVNNNDKIQKTAEIINRMLLRKHNELTDFKIIVPELLLEQERNTKRIFNLVLGAIASISLIVGGIGIMNIMLASVLERTKEIGIRRAIGATQKDILLQFLIEAVTISITGGIIGIILGIGMSFLIESGTGIKTIISAFSVFISFIVSITVGLIFGITPARKASLEEPIDLLRYE